LVKHLAVLLFVPLIGSLQLRAQAVSCESSPAVADANRILGEKLETATFEQSIVLREQAYRQMSQLDPLDFRLLRRYLQSVHYDAPEKWDTLREQAIADLAAHPNDPVRLSAAALLLTGKDTPRAFRLMDQAIAANPKYAPAYVELAGMYKNLGKFEDKDKAASGLAKFYELCPSSSDSRALSLLKVLGSKALKEQVAEDLRRRLATSTDPHFLQTYSDVWAIEFSNLATNEYSKERQRVTEDLKRLEQVPVETTSNWLGFLRDGYKQSSVAEAHVDALESRILKDFPHSNEAFGIKYEKWRDQHPEPAGEAAIAEWQQYMRLAASHYRDLMAAFPQEHGFGYSLVEYSANLDGASNEEIVHNGEDFIKDSDLYEGPSSWVRQYFAGILLDHSLQPARALALLREARTLKNSPRETVYSEAKDYSKPKDIEDSVKNRAADQASYNVLYLRACRAAGDKAAAEELKATVEAAPPIDSKLLADYWRARAILAQIEGRNTDSLAFYQRALFVREAPTKQYGKLDDLLLADAHSLWTAAQGSEAAFAIWSQPDKTANTALAEGHWEKPDKELPAFELADLQGKTWKLASLEGKKVLINIWATWCGPCQAELPHLEKLYQQTKDRSDIAILTLNFDDEPGLIEPFVKKKGYTFPVLPAYAFLVNKIDVNSIPRNWVVNPNGKWQWEEIGFYSGEADWEKSMLARLDSLK